MVKIFGESYLIGKSISEITSVPQNEVDDDKEYEDEETVAENEEIMEWVLSKLATYEAFEVYD